MRIGLGNEWRDCCDSGRDSQDVLIRAERVLDTGEGLGEADIAASSCNCPTIASPPSWTWHTGCA